MKGIRNSVANGAASAQGYRADDLPVPSRREALETLRKEVTVENVGPVLLTGEPGAGKTWLWRRFVRELPAQWHWLSVDMSESLNAPEFLELIGHGLGISSGDRLGASRLALARALEEESTEGRSWILVLENAQNTSEQVWTELQNLVHEMEASAGFAGMILVGPTELARLLATRIRRAIASRLGVHIHLLPLDLEECRQLAEVEGRVGSLDRAVLEELHRDAAGNPRRVLQLLRAWTRRVPVMSPRAAYGVPGKLPELKPEPCVSRSSPAPADRLVPASASPVTGAAGDRPGDLAESSLAPPLVPSRPPLRVEEGLIEVGWEGNLGAELTAENDSESLDEAVEAELPTAANHDECSTEETIEDHYAALQAWTEWARNRGRLSGAEIPATGMQPAEVLTRETIDEDDTRQGQSRLVPSIRAETQHEHAPYSQLFSQLRQSK
jgi:type II secretory pathway predicted ATPase ExeA